MVFFIVRIRWVGRLRCWSMLVIGSVVAMWTMQVIVKISRHECQVSCTPKNQWVDNPMVSMRLKSCNEINVCIVYAVDNLHYGFSKMNVDWMIEQLFDLSLYKYLSFLLLCCSSNTLFTILKSWWRFTKTETF